MKNINFYHKFVIQFYFCVKPVLNAKASPVSIFSILCTPLRPSTFPCLLRKKGPFIFNLLSNLYIFPCQRTQAFETEKLRFESQFCLWHKKYIYTPTLSLNFLVWNVESTTHRIYIGLKELKYLNNLNNV